MPDLIWGALGALVVAILSLAIGWFMGRKSQDKPAFPVIPAQPNDMGQPAMEFDAWDEAMQHGETKETIR